MSKEEKRSLAVPAVIGTALVICLGSGAAFYLNRDKGTAPVSENTQEMTTVSTVSETVSETAAETVPETSVSETTDGEKTEPVRKNSISGVFGRVNTTKGTLSVRKGPSSNSDITGKLEKDTLVYISGEENGWYQIENNSKNGGYVSADYILLSDYSGTWTEKYRQIAEDIQEYFGEAEEASGFLKFALMSLDSDSIPELIYSYSPKGSENSSYFQIFSADETSLYIDRRRFGAIASPGYNSTTQELCIKRNSNAEYQVSLGYTDENISETSFFHSCFNYSGQDKTDLYMINGNSVTGEEYETQYKEHSGSSEPEWTDFRVLAARLSSASASAQTFSEQDTIIYPAEKSETVDSVKFSYSSFDHFFGILESDTSEIPLFSDSASKKKYGYELSGTIVQVTGEENGMYQILYKAENSSQPAEILYVNKQYISCDRKAESWAEKYDEVIRLRENSNGDRHSTLYTLADMNYDDMPELIALTTLASSDDKYISVYSVYDGQLIDFSFENSCSGFTFYPSSGCIGAEGTDSNENITMLSLGRGTFKAESTFTFSKISSDEYEYTVDGTVVTEEEYYEKKSVYISDEEEPEDEQYTNLTPLKALDVLSGY